MEDRENKYNQVKSNEEFLGYVENDNSNYEENTDIEKSNNNIEKKNNTNKKKKTKYKNINKYVKKIFGVGTYGYNTNGVNVGSLENTFRMFLICYGYIGIAVFIMFLGYNSLTNFLKTIIYKKYRKEYLFVFLLFIVFVLHSWTLETIYLPTIYFSTAFLYGYMYDKINRGENIIEDFNSK
jgi:hypothetical protein